MSSKSLPVVGTVVVGVVLSLWGFLFLQIREQRVLSADFRAMAGDQVSTIEREVLANLEVLESLRAFYNAVPRVGPEQFESFAEPLLRQHRTIQALEWIPRVPNEEKGRYISQARDKYPAFNITERQAQGVMIPARERSEYFPVYYVEPYEGNEINTPTQFISDNTVFLKRAFTGLIDALNQGRLLLNEASEGSVRPETV